MNGDSSPSSEFDQRKLTAQEKLIIGWQQSYANLKGLYEMRIEEARSRLHFEGQHEWEISKPQREFIDLCAPSGFAAEVVAEFGAQLYGRGIGALKAFIDGSEEFKRLFGWPDDVLDLTALVLELGRFHPNTTDSGTKVLWLDSASQSFRFLIPNPSEFPDWFDIVDYWHRVPRFYLPWDLGLLVDGSDVPMDLTSTASNWAKLPQAEDIGKSTAVAKALLEEAYTNKRWTIPNKALVQPSFGPFTHFEASEVSNQVYFVGRNERREFAVFGVDVLTKFFYFPYRAGAARKVDLPSVTAALRLVLAAIVRDFWVVEERNTVFDEKSPKKVAGTRIQLQQDDEPRVVYIPRVRYRQQPDLDRCAQQLEHEARAGHLVRAHARKVGSPSEQQVLLAEKYGFPLPSGHTFVRPHERGSRERQIIYRSRSALRSLFVAEEVRSTSKIRWFAFEKDVEQLMATLGFEVQHCAASRSGDHGIDLYATKGNDLELINWVVQCKCYSPHRHVGPNVVRELYGALATHPRGTRGLIVTTSRFTEGAKRLAAELNIRLMNGDEFSSRLGNSK
jgi:hypothetical protein